MNEENKIGYYAIIPSKILFNEKNIIEIIVEQRKFKNKY